MISFVAGNYHVMSHGNGWGYEITDQTDGHLLWFQDSDASAIQAETNDFENTDVLAEYFACID